MKLVITIEMDNAAFEDANGFEVARILTKLAREVKDHQLETNDTYGLMDDNGNTVGKAEVKR